MTPAIQAAKKANIRYSIHEYQHDPDTDSYGKEAALALGVEARRVFKTLLVTLHGARNGLAVAIVPVEKRLDLKSFAAAANAKKAVMADPKEAERATGYVVGGISPFGQKRRLPVIIDASISGYDTVYVSAGRRGLEIELDPRDLIRLCNAEVAPIQR
jgi:Cys-tRNA(Pro)/Cys-tRNA(Cys) deacylase